MLSVNPLLRDVAILTMVDQSIKSGKRMSIVSYEQ
jgi:hypothetical protein